MNPRCPCAALRALALLGLLGLVALFGPIVALGGGRARAADVRFALIVGWNQADDPGLDPLRYADDDALRYYELFAAISERAILLTTPDDETRALIADRTDPIAQAGLEAPAPTRAHLLDAVQTLRAAMQRAKARGDRPILYFVYSGHGAYDAEGRGYVHLADGRFTTRDLFARILAPTADDPVVLIIDACNAALMVNGRGKPAAPDPERRPAGPSKLDLADYPNVGVVLASSELGETHEWGRYLAGVFSHEVRSGLLGAADLDDDQQVTFAELAAFVASANARVKNPTVKLTPYIRPPLTDPNLALVDLSHGTFRGRVRIDAHVVGKAHLLDSDLVRYADFHRTADAPAFWLALTRPGELVLSDDGGEWVIPESASGDFPITSVEHRAHSEGTAARGPGSEYFDRTLFHEPYDNVFAQRYLTIDYPKALELQRLVEAPWWDNSTAWVVLGAGLASAAAGIGMELRADALADDARATPWADERHRLDDELGTFSTGSAILYGVGGAAIVSSIVMFAIDQPTHVETWRPPLDVELDERGVRLRTRW